LFCIDNFREHRQLSTAMYDKYGTKSDTGDVQY
jgi:hypothetical protein